eukprot:2484130-Prymnesium_polylepis.1
MRAVAHGWNVSLRRRRFEVRFLARAAPEAREGASAERRPKELWRSGLTTTIAAIRCLPLPPPTSGADFAVERCG